MLERKSMTNSNRKAPSKPWADAGSLLAAFLVVLFALPSVIYGASPEQFRQKVGIYIWGRVPNLEIAVSDAKRLGADRVVRAFMGPWSDTPPYRDDLRPLREKAVSSDYQSLFNSFPVIMLTTYDSTSYSREYGSEAGTHLGSSGAPGKRHHPSHPSLKLAKDIAGMSRTDQSKFLKLVRQEFRDFSFELSRLDRTFIICNWEAENDVPEVKYWPWFARYLQARLDGIMAGRNEAREGGYPARVFTAFEFTIVPGFQGKPSGLVDIGRILHGLDYLSYSSWRSIGWDYDNDKTKESFRYGIQLIRSFAKQSALPQRIVIGEFGEYWDMHPDAERLKSLIEVSIDEGVEYLFNWVLYEQPGERDDWGRDASHVGKFFLDRTLTPQGKAFQKWLSEPTMHPAARASATETGQVELLY